MRLDELTLGQDLKSAEHKKLPAGPTKLENIAKKIKLNCSKFLNQRSDKAPILYRGYSRIRYQDKTAPKLFVERSRDNRLPTGSAYNDPSEFKKYSQYTQLSCDLCLQINGFTALRSNSTFCNSDLNKASSWGRPYVIFPINGFTFGYSNIKSGIPAAYYYWDTYFKERLISFVQFENYTGNKLPTVIPDNILEYATKFVIDNEMMKTDLKQAMITSKDTWIHGTYIAVDHKFFISRSIINGEWSDSLEDLLR